MIVPPGNENGIKYRERYTHSPLSRANEFIRSEQIFSEFVSIMWLVPGCANRFPKRRGTILPCSKNRSFEKADKERIFAESDWCLKFYNPQNCIRARLIPGSSSHRVRP
jgi:hypothetical protein